MFNSRKGIPISFTTQKSVGQQVLESLPPISDFLEDSKRTDEREARINQQRIIHQQQQQQQMTDSQRSTPNAKDPALQSIGYVGSRSTFGIQQQSIPEWKPKNPTSVDEFLSNVRKGTGSPRRVQIAVQNEASPARASVGRQGSTLRMRNQTTAKHVVHGIPATGVPHKILPENDSIIISPQQFIALGDLLLRRPAMQKYSFTTEWQNSDDNRNGAWCTWVGASTDVTVHRSQQGETAYALRVHWIPDKCPGLLDHLHSENKNSAAASNVHANYALPLPYPNVVYRSIRLNPSVDAAATPASVQNVASIETAVQIPASNIPVVVEGINNSDNGDNNNDDDEQPTKKFTVKLAGTNASFPTLTNLCPDPVTSGPTRYNVDPFDAESWWKYVLSNPSDWERRMWDIAEVGGWHITTSDCSDHRFETLRTYLLLTAHLMFEHASKITVYLMNRLTFEAFFANEARNNSKRQSGRINIAAARSAVLSPQSPQNSMRLLMQEHTEKSSAAAEKSTAKSSKKTEEKKACYRCGRTNHLANKCHATIHVSGGPLQQQPGFRGGGSTTPSGAANPVAPRATNQQL